MVLVDNKTEFTFSELSPEIQEKLIKSEAEYIHDCGFDYISSCITDEFESELTQLGISDIEIAWEGFYNQDSGAKFTGSISGTENIKKFVTNALGLPIFECVAETLEISFGSWYKGYFRNPKRAIDSSHLAASVECDESEVEWLIGTGVNLKIDVEKAAEKIEWEAHTWAINKANELYNRLEKSYVLHTSHDNIKTHLTNSDTVYDEFGEVIR